MGSLAAAPNPYTGTVEVPTMNLDALLRDEAIDLVVCDVEGAETVLFQDADLSGVDRIFLEMHDHVTGLSGVRGLFATWRGTASSTTRATRSAASCSSRSSAPTGHPPALRRVASAPADGVSSRRPARGRGR